MNNDEFVLLSRCYTFFEAEMIRGILNGAGIESFATNQLVSHILRDRLLASNNSVDVYVRKEDAELAITLLKADFVEE